MKFFRKSKSKAKVKKEDVPLRGEGKERTFDRTTPSQGQQLHRKYSRRPQAVAEVSEIPTRVNTLRSEYRREFAPTNSVSSGPNRQISAYELNSDGKLYQTEKAERPLPKTPWLLQTVSISETNNKDLRAENTRLTKNLFLLERQVEESSKTIENLRQNAEGSKGSWEQRTRKLEKDLEVSESRNSSMIESLKKAELDSNQREKWIAKVERQLEERNESAREEVSELEKRNDQARNQAVEKQREIEDLMKKLDIEKKAKKSELENLRACHILEQTGMKKSLEYKLKDLRNCHMQEQRQMKRSLVNQAYNFRKQIEKNEKEMDSLHCELMHAQLALEESKRSNSKMRARLNAIEALLSQRENRITELEQQIQENTDMIADTRLILNQSRNELNVEKRKARQASLEVADKNRKLEFLQQECAKMSGDLIKRRYQ